MRISISVVRRATVTGLLLFGCEWKAHAQTAPASLPVPSVPPVTAGACSIVVTISPVDSSPASVVDIDINGMWIARQALNGRPTVTFLVKAPLQHTDTVRARIVGPHNADGRWTNPVTVSPGTGKLECPDPTQKAAPVDQRPALSATAYFGGAYDNFAPAEVGGYNTNDKTGYVNPNAGDRPQTRSIVGVDFEFRAIGSETSRVQLWLAGETLYGIRSGDVDCTTPATERPPVCETIAKQFGVDPQKTFLYGLAHASSLEAYIQPRLELGTLQGGTAFPSRAYVTVRLGINMLRDGVHEAFDAFHVGGGLLSIGGPFEGSFLEAGWGKSELFFTEPGHTKWRRLKIDGLLSFPILQAFTDKAKFWKKAPRAFVQLYSDFDPRGRSADSVQTFFGLDFDIVELFRW